jgi:hypothetical protein
MYTVQDIYNITIDLIDEKLATGAINANTTAVYKARTPGILNLWQGENLSNSDLFSEHEISCKPATNMLGYKSGMDYLEYKGVEKTIEVDGSVKQYYFEVDGEGTVYIEDFNGNWNTLATIVVPSTVTSFTAYKDIVTPSPNATKSRLRFSGPYRYIITNYALFDIPVSPSKLIMFRPWVKHEMPEDFKSVEQIVEEYCDRQMEKATSYKWIGRGDLYIDYFYEGNIRISYKPVPKLFTSLADTLQVDEITSLSGAYFLAAHLLLEENPASASFFNGRYLELKALSNPKQVATIQDIVDVYSMDGGGYYS